MVLPRGMNGLDLTNRLRASNVELEESRRAIFGADITYLAKPYTTSVLAKAIKERLNPA
jgi:hypothetical protein